ncbi:MAG: fibronectin type III domain-containing protein [Bacteroidales bacterium]|nr:fibronectin type III domain-containing protein [Bacteroidales bacterium]
MKKLLFFCVIPLLISCTGTSKKSFPFASITVTNNIVNEEFGGMGFHVFYHSHDAPMWHYEEVFAKRWRELNPSFARITDFPGWDPEKIDDVARYLEVMKDTETELYFTTWGAGVINEYEDELDYVKKQIDNLEYWRRNKEFENLKYYCMTNELSLDEWASLVKNNDLDRFKDIHQLFYDELKSRDLDIKLLATDASPFTYWPTIEWAAENMDEITGVYGGHHYINSYDLFDQSFYPFFLEKMKWGANLAREKNKNFIVGEFGPKQNSNIIDSVKHDACIYNNTPLERYVGIQVAEAIIAMINGGIYASSYWTFCDFPSGYRSTYINKWGVFKWEIDDFTTRPSYYALGLLTKFFRGPAKVFEVNTTDTLLRVCAIKNSDKNTISIAIINRNNENRKLNLQLEPSDSGLTFRKYVYDPENVPFNYFGDLQSPSGKITLVGKILEDIVPPNSLVVYTSDFDENPPAPVKNLMVEKIKIDRDRNVLTWNPSDEDDFCYYRIYRAEQENVEVSPLKQIATTISTKYIDKRVHGLPQYYYKVVAVDNSGNSSK